MGNQDDRHPSFEQLIQATQAFELELSIANRQRFVDDDDIGVDMGGDCKSNPALRRALWWRFLVIQLLEAGPRVRWMRYEDLVAAPEKMTALLLTHEPLPVLAPIAWRKELPPAERDLVVGVLRDVAERLQYIL
ncbi:hypothetical protein [Pseudomonas sp.]|uniref:hypothetical protein n=1 Tax=Pseudomonas sp. TaxID=306 RepID=UPI0031E07E41